MVCVQCGALFARRSRCGPLPRFCSIGCSRASRADVIRQRNRAFAEANRDYLRASAAAYYRENAEAIRERVARYRAEKPEDPQRHSERSKEYYRRVKAARPNAYAEKRARRRALEASATVGVIDFDAILASDGSVCHICGIAIPSGDLHFDHVVPLSRGGAHSADNLKPAHSRCNAGKGARLLEEMV